MARNRRGDSRDKYSEQNRSIKLHLRLEGTTPGVDGANPARLRRCGLVARCSICAAAEYSAFASQHALLSKKNSASSIGMSSAIKLVDRVSIPTATGPGKTRKR